MECTKRTNEGNLTKYELIPEAFQKAMLKANGKPVVFVTVFGANSGKTTTIKILKNDPDIEKKSKGAFIYGPISLNEFRERYNMKQQADDDTQIFFVDIEGCDGIKSGGNLETKKSILSQLILPYSILSNVLITIIGEKTSLDQVLNIKIMLDIIKTVQSVTEKYNFPTNIIALVPNTERYYPTKGQFAKFQKKVTKKIHKMVGIEEAIPLSQYDINSSPFEQGDEFNEGFKIFARNVIHHIEEAREKTAIDSELASKIFKMISEKDENESITEITEKCIKCILSSSISQIYTPIVDNIIREGIKALEEINEDLGIKIEQNNIKLPEINENEIIEKSIEKLDKQLEQTNIKEMEIYNEFKQKITEKISEEFKKTLEYLDKIKEIQFLYIKRMIEKRFEEESDKLKNLIENHDVTEINDNEIFDKIKSEIFDECNEINFLIDDKVNEFIDNQKEIFTKEINIYMNIEQNTEKDQMDDKRLNKIINEEIKQIPNLDYDEFIKLIPNIPDNVLRNAIKKCGNVSDEDLEDKIKSKKMDNDELFLEVYGNVVDKIRNLIDENNYDIDFSQMINEIKDSISNDDAIPDDYKVMFYDSLDELIK
ncbi:hypothetical protein GPJ56_005042 [Histomonas meleagridis]|uniref:uncharacterized protein n=1 Tax=Histomonas meleagridis TaxID=135588 RepID=UPI0035599DB2|nr:hypothetical protein GPJ56_005042 [Histomonas meleagridis]KAH0802559.1 hypothetical protein GO595_004608 [Histomonas meleagridis]